MRLGATLAVAAILATGSAGGFAVGAAAGTGSSSALPTATYEAGPSAAMIPGDLGWYSSNWAGYAVGGGRHMSVSAQWTVPAVSASARPGYSALWVGMDGFTNDALIQAGTEADFYGGVAHYTAWWEILPAPAVAIHSLSVRAGDRVSVTIARASAGRWRITIKDARSGCYATTRAYSGPATSAEWIEEAPIVEGRATRLAVHGTVVFDNATLDGRNPKLAIENGGAMIRRGVLVDTPSAPDADANGFALAQQPIPPAPPGS
jgi:hypothetical protein